MGMINRYKKKMEKEIKEQVLKEISVNQNKNIKEKHPIKVESPQKKVNNSAKDIEAIRLKMFYGLIVITCLIVASIMYLMYGDKLFNNKNYNTIEEEQVEVDDKYKEIYEFENGSIPIDNIYVNEIIETHLYSVEEQISINYSELYSANNVVSELDTSKQFMLLGKTKEFTNIIDDYELDSEAKICYKEGTITIPKNEVDQIWKDRFNILEGSKETFTYNYYIDSNLIARIEFVYSDGKYVSRCINNDELTVPEKIIKSKIYTAEKEDDNLYLYGKVAFLTSSGGYTDYLLTNRIENPNNVPNLDYALYGSQWKYTYKLNDNNEYYLYSISEFIQAQ